MSGKFWNLKCTATESLCNVIISSSTMVLIDMRLIQCNILCYFQRTLVIAIRARSSNFPDTTNIICIYTLTVRIVSRSVSWLLLKYFYLVGDITSNLRFAVRDEYPHVLVNYFLQLMLTHYPPIGLDWNEFNACSKWTTQERVYIVIVSPKARL